MPRNAASFGDCGSHVVVPYNNDMRLMFACGAPLETLPRDTVEAMNMRRLLERFFGQKNSAASSESRDHRLSIPENESHEQAGDTCPELRIEDVDYVFSIPGRRMVRPVKVSRYQMAFRPRPWTLSHALRSGS